MVRSRKGGGDPGEHGRAHQPSGRNAHEAVSGRVRIGDASVFVQDDGFKGGVRQLAEAGLAFCQRGVACLQFVRHFLQCLPQVVEIATALKGAAGG